MPREMPPKAAVDNIAMKPSSKNMFTKAVGLREKGQFRSAIALLEDLSKLEPDNAAVFGTLGHAYWNVCDYDKACAAFRSAIEEEPLSEAYSLGLFHCLWALEKHDDAFEEIKRFTNFTHSEDYMKIIKEINEKFDQTDT